MFALQLLYLCGIGIWIGSLIIARYFVPVAVIQHINNPETSRIIILSVIRKVHTVGLACFMCMGGSLFLQSLLKGQFSGNGLSFILIGVMLLLLGIMELIVRNQHTKVSQIKDPYQISDSESTLMQVRKLISWTLRLLILIQIFLSLIVLYVELI